MVWPLINIRLASSKRLKVLQSLKSYVVLNTPLLFVADKCTAGAGESPATAVLRLHVNGHHRHVQ